MAIDLTNGYTDLVPHVDHDIECVVYAGGTNVALECMTCGCVLIDFDAPEDDDATP